MSENIIKQTKDDKKFLIMAHRGFWGGNVIQNTRQAAITAKKAGADIIEVDVCRSADGVYYLFHKLVVRMLLDVDKEFEEVTSEEIDFSVTQFKWTKIWLPSRKVRRLSRLASNKLYCKYRSNVRLLK